MFATSNPNGFELTRHSSTALSNTTAKNLFIIKKLPTKTTFTKLQFRTHLIKPKRPRITVVGVERWVGMRTNNRNHIEQTVLNETTIFKFATTLKH
jgi:hypothetical protein